MNPVTELFYGNTRTYLVRGGEGYLLFDTAWAGTFPLFCRALGAAGVSSREIRYLLISHYHPDHMGIARDITDLGVQLLVPDVQAHAVHRADAVYAKEKRTAFRPIDDAGLRVFPLKDSRDLLKEAGIDGEILHTPGHSDDSISLYLEEGIALVGDLNPLYELALHEGTQIGRSWELLLARHPKKVYYGHAREAELGEAPPGQEMYGLVQAIIQYIDRGYPLQKIQKKTGADPVLTEDVARMYLTHPNVSVQGILDRIEIKNR